jgi:hypothetical protein
MTAVACANSTATPYTSPLLLLQLLHGVYIEEQEDLAESREAFNAQIRNCKVSCGKPFLLARVKSTQKRR